MKNIKLKNIISLLLNVLIVAFTVFAILKYWTSMGDGNMQDKGAECLKYFTNLSNIFVALTALVIIPLNIKNLKSGTNLMPAWAFKLKFVATISVTVTFLTCVFFLGPMFGIMWSGSGASFITGYLFLFKGNVFFLHFLTPVLAIISVIFCERTDSFTKKQATLGVLPTVVYSFLYAYQVIIVGSENGGWTDFYGFTFGGNTFLTIVSVIVMYFGTLLLSRLERYLNARVNS